MRKLQKDQLTVEIHADRPALGKAAADAVTEKIRELMEKQEQVNIVFAAAPSQNEFLIELRTREIEWSRVNAFHMDEYVGVDENATQLFGNFLKEKIFKYVNPGQVFYMKGDGDHAAECKRYTELLDKYPTDIVLLGIGENTHVAFNDPHVAFFDDKETVKVVDLDEKNRNQQVDPSDPSCFNTLDEVPTHAITLTVPALRQARYAYAIAPGKNKAAAIYYTLSGEITEKYPSTIFRKHLNAVLFIDEDSAALLEPLTLMRDPDSIF